MRRYSALLLLLLISVGGCTIGGLDLNGEKGSGVAKTEKRELPPFTAIDTSGPFNIEILCQQEKQSVEISGDDNLLPIIKTEVVNNVLKIKPEKGISPKTQVKVSIAVPNIESIETSGISHVKLASINNEKLDIQESGAGQVEGSGKTKELKIQLSGAGQMDLKGLKAEKAEVQCSGAGQISLYVSEDLKANLSGAGQVSYFGNPKNVSQNVSGIGKISKGD